jgi:hypothetical protein
VVGDVPRNGARIRITRNTVNKGVLAKSDGRQNVGHASANRRTLAQLSVQLTQRTGHFVNATLTFENHRFAATMQPLIKSRDCTVIDPKIIENQP